MSNILLCENDNYTLPELLKEETPESKAMLAEKLNQIKVIAARIHKEAEEAESKEKALQL